MRRNRHNRYPLIILLIFLIFLIFPISFFVSFASDLSAASPRDRDEETEVETTAKAFDFEQMPCPSPMEYYQLKKAFKFLGTLEGNLCQDHSPKTNFAKTLYYITSHLKFPVPPSWKGGAHGADEALENTEKYLKRQFKGMRMAQEFERVLYPLFNGFNDSGFLILSPLFFEQNFVGMLKTLIHEARHSSLQGERHVPCQRSKHPPTQNWCDPWFRTDDQAGGHAYTVSFMLGQAKLNPHLSESERIAFTVSALEDLENFFNAIPPSLGLWFETLVARDGRGGLYSMHPFLKVPIPYREHRDRDREHLKSLEVWKIKHNILNDRLFLFSGDGDVYWDDSFSLRSLLTSDDDRFDFIRDMALVHDSKGDLKSYFINSHGLFSEEIPMVTPISWDNDFVQMTSSKGGLIYIRSAKGGLWVFNTRDRTLRMSKFQNPYYKTYGEGWAHLYSTHYLPFVHAINQAGVHFYFDAKNESTSARATLHESNFQVEKAVSYFSTDSLEVQSDVQGKIFVRRRDKNAITSSFDLDSIDVREISHVKSLMMSPSFGIPYDVNMAIVEACDLSLKHGMDPWTKLTMGITSNHQLAFQVSQTQCQVFDVGGKAMDYNFSGTHRVIGQEDFTTPFLMVTVKTDEGETLLKTYAPYNY